MTAAARAASSSPSRNSMVAEQARLLKADEVAVRWSVSKALVYRLSREGRLPTVKIGRNFRYRLAAIEEFEAAGGVGADD